jgi:hypothetical protein
MKKPLIIAILFLLTIPAISQEKAKEKAKEPEKKETVETPKAWPVPDYVLNSLNALIEKFNKEFKSAVETYKAGLKVTDPIYKDMPDNVLVDLQNKIFITKKDMDLLRKKQQEGKAKVKDAKKKVS